MYSITKIQGKVPHESNRYWSDMVEDAVYVSYEHGAGGNDETILIEINDISYEHGAGGKMRPS